MTGDERFLSFVDNASVGIYRSTPDGQIVLANGALVRMMGFDSFEELARRNLELEGYEPTYKRKRFKEEIERDGSIRGLEAAWKRRDGSTIFVRESASVTRDPQGRILYYDGIIEDVSERKKAEEALRDSEERFRILTEAAFEGVFITENGLIRDVNDQGLRMFGYERAEMVGKPVVSFVSEESRPLVEAAIQGQVEKTYEHQMVRRDGSRFYVQAQAKMMRMGEQTLRMTALRDITEKKKAENELSRANRALRTISQCNQTIARATNEEELLRAICQAAVQSGRYSFAWVGFAMDDEEKSVVPIAFSGVDKEYVDKFRITWGESDRGRGPTGTAIRTGKPSKSRNHNTDERVAPWRQFGNERGILSSLALPLSVDGRVLGSLSIYAAEPDAFDDEEVKLLTELADDTANGIRTLRARADRQRSEEALRQSEDRFRSAMQHSPIGMALVAPGGRWLEVNPSLCKIIGYRSAELLGLDVQSVTHPEDLQLVMESMRLLLEGRADSFEREMRYVHKDGREVWVQLNVSLISNPDGAPRHFVTQIQDVTGRRQAEQSLRSYQSKLILAMDMAKLGHWEYEVSSGRFTFDQSFYKLLGTTIAREGGMWMSAEDYARRFVVPEEIPVVTREIDNAVAATDPEYTRQMEHGFVRLDGSTGIMSVRFAIMKDSAGRTVRTYGLNQDITEQRKAEQQRQKLEEQLRQSQKMEALGTLAGGIAHDFNNILTGIMGHLQLAEMDLPEEHPALAMVRESGVASRRARDLVARILSFSRLERADRSVAPIGPIVLEAVHLLRASIPSKIEIRTGVDASCPPVRCDAAQIHQVIINLGTNAAHAMESRSGVLTVDLRSVVPDKALMERHPQVNPGHTVCLTIRDTGIGMDAAVLKRIFEPFYTTKAFGQGTGLGLSIVHAIVQHHGGSIAVESEAGRGTTFSLYFPGVGARPANAALVGSSSAPGSLVPFGRDRAILLVDDEAAVRSFGGDALRRLGFRPQVAAHPAVALEAFRASPAAFCAVISDLTMPDMTGLELARHILKARPDTPFILASGYLNADASDKARKSGVTCVISKPFEMRELAARLRSVLNEAPPVPDADGDRAPSA